MVGSIACLFLKVFHIIFSCRQKGTVTPKRGFDERIEDFPDVSSTKTIYRPPSKNIFAC